MIRRPLVIALATAVRLSALLPATASAEDLLQTYELARGSDPQFSAAESSRLAVKEGAVQTRAAMLPQINGTASITRSAQPQPRRRQSPIPTARSAAATADTDTHHARHATCTLSQMIYDRGNFTRHKSAKALSEASDFQLAGRRQRPDHAHLGGVLQRADRTGVAGRRRSRRNRAEEAVRLRLQAPGSRPGADHRRARSPRPVRQRARQHHPGPQRGRGFLPGAGRAHRPARSATSRACRRTSSRRCPNRATPKAGCRPPSRTIRRCAPRTCRCSPPKPTSQTARAGHWPTPVPQRQLRRQHDRGATHTCSDLATVARRSTAASSARASA